jgi:hypothetical protein
LFGTWATNATHIKYSLVEETVWGPCGKKAD